MNGLVALAVYIQSRRLDDGLQGSVLEAAAGVIAAIAYLQGACVDVGLLAEERVVEELVAPHLLGALQLE